VAAVRFILSMRRSSARLGTLTAACLAAVALPACETEFVTIAPEVSTSAPVIGHVKGVSYRHLLAGSPSYNILPLWWSGCVSRACERAMEQAPGAVALKNVTVEEDWFWWGIGSARTLVLEGDAVPAEAK
jgi:hypothetical protein